ncbi:MAG: hypothetical protein V1754_04080 [Pseudomonadota bacterium]
MKARLSPIFVALLPLACGQRALSVDEDAMNPDSIQTLDSRWEFESNQVACTNNNDCDPEEFCKFLNSCGPGTPDSGEVPEVGQCELRPEECGDGGDLKPVCGCDGITYGSQCETYVNDDTQLKALKKQWDFLGCSYGISCGEILCAELDGSTCNSKNSCEDIFLN